MNSRDSLYLICKFLSQKISGRNLHSNFLFNQFILLFLTIAFSYCVTCGQNKPQSIDDLNVPIRKNSKTTYSDLADLVFPVTGENTRKSVPLSNLHGDYKDEILEGNIEIHYARAVWINNQGIKQLLLLINVTDSKNSDQFVWGEMNVLALFDIENKPKLIDVVDVQGDRFASFWDQQPILALNPKTNAFVITNNHFNAGESYQILTIVGIVKNRLKAILDDIPILNAVNTCGNTFEEQAFLRTVPKAKSAYSSININIKHIKHADEPECERKTRGYVKNYWFRYAWSNAQDKYIKLKGRK